MSGDTLTGFVEATAEKSGIPGVAVGVWADGREVYACHGVTNVDNPLPVDRDTLFVLGSVTKTYTATAQFAELLTVPERSFAVVSLSNAGPHGISFNQAVVRWALQTYLSVTDRDPEPLPYDEARARELVGHYESDAMDVTIATDGAVMTLAVDIKPEIRAAADKELPPGYPREEIGLLPGDGDDYIITDGGMKGMRGFFTRDGSGAVAGIDIGGRMHSRAQKASG